jgi:hypothetical protein
MKKRKDDEWDDQIIDNWGVSCWWTNTCRTKIFLSGECSTQWAFLLKRSAIIKHVSQPKI